MMKYRILGRSGLRVSQLSLGTMTFGEAQPWSRPESDCRAVFDAYVEAGGNFIDTANMYTGGESERMVGRFIASDRERFVVATKYTNAIPGRGDPNEGGMHRKNMVQSVDKCLQRLGVDYIDLFYAHFWDFTTPAEEILRAFDDLVRAGKILHMGLSDVPAWAVARMQTFSQLHLLTPVACMQLEYSLVQRSIEREHLPMAKALDIGVTAWSPLAGGILSGKYSRQQKTEGARRLDSMQLQAYDERNAGIAQQVDAVADRLGVSSAEVALAWIMSRNIIPIIGATSAQQMRENIKSCDLTLDTDTLATLDQASAFDLGHPYSMLEWDMPMALGFAGLRERIDIPNFPGERP